MSTLSERLRIATLPTADIELPEELSRLEDLAYNLWWAWNPRARWLFRRIDEETWDLYRNPVQLLINVEPGHWSSLLEDGDFRALYDEVIASLDSYLDGAAETWFGRRVGEQARDPRRPVAYFSMEYGLHQSLALYSGGLGVLSGDHTKSASDLGVPFVGIGLLYRHGYFRQTIDADGMQQHGYPTYDFHRLPLLPTAVDGEPLIVEIPFPDRTIQAKVWLAEVGRAALLLLDTDIPENHPADRPITNILYVRGREMRLAQEMVLGVGGVRAIRALGLEPSVWHLNEGHCSFLLLERLRELGNASPAPRALDHRLAEISETTVFTTHTPVPAGNERFDRRLVHRYLAPWESLLHVGADQLLDLGDAGRPDDPQFNMTALALRSSRTSNAVSELNAEVSNEMWNGLAGQRSGPILPITNGVHTTTWAGREMREIFARHLGPNWQEALLRTEAWNVLGDLSDAELWQAHQAQKERLGRFVCRRIRVQFARHGRSPDRLRRVETAFDPQALTVVFARRFATYKRAKLVFRDLERLARILCDPERPVQLLFAGKAHPADRPGQELIQEIFQLSQRHELEGRIFFIEDYDMRIGRRLVQGADVWLNTPRRPLEASGTSGQKAALNGALNCSILDGWWPEGFDGSNGFAIGANQNGEGTEEEQDAADAEALYQLLETEIVPLFYDRDAAGHPVEWIRRMRGAVISLTAPFSSHRMVRDYVERSYFPGLGEDGPS